MTNNKETYKIAKERYNSLLSRSFVKQLKLFAFYELSQGKSNEDLTIKRFTYFLDLIDGNKELRDQLLESYHQYTLLFEGDNLKQFLKEMHGIAVIPNISPNMEAVEIAEKIRVFSGALSKGCNTFKDFYKENFFKKVPFDIIKALFGSDTEDRTCEYCGITEKEIERLGDEFLLNKDFINYPRGTHFEIDRADPKDDYRYYTESNKILVISCYWCNNAKTDEFTFKEFKQIGMAIGDIWKKRLAVG